MFEWLFRLLGINRTQPPEIERPRKAVEQKPPELEHKPPPKESCGDSSGRIISGEEAEFLKAMVGGGPPGDLQALSPADRSFISLLIKKTNAGDLSIPLLPQAAVSLRKLGSNPDVNISKYVEIFKEDPALSAELLKLANSPYFGMATPTHDLAQAMMRVGFNELSGLVMLMTMRSKILRSGQYNAENELMAKLAQATARGAENLAEELGVGSDEAFTRGLLSHVELFVILGLATEFNGTHKGYAVSREALVESAKRFGPGIFDLVVKKWGLENLGYTSDASKSEESGLPGLRGRITEISAAIAGAWTGLQNLGAVEGISSERLTEAARTALGLTEDKKMPPPQGGLAEGADG